MDESSSPGAMWLKPDLSGLNRKQEKRNGYSKYIQLYHIFSFQGEYKGIGWQLAKTEGSGGGEQFGGRAGSRQIEVGHRRLDTHTHAHAR